ncbi:unnamed protein product [Lasius platythorax]|uniref:Uncharacterized protein n=1 Tax=Lasius platythorax TaxID=488582 RepID=A0AAV2NZ83_9HYME
MIYCQIKRIKIKKRSTRIRQERK